MKRYVSVLAILLSLLCLHPPELYAMTDMKRTDGTIAWTTTGVTQVYPVASTWKCNVLVKSESTSTATVTIEGAQDATNGPWVILATITDPDSTGKYFGGPSPTFIRVNAVITSGTISARLDAQGPGGSTVF
jgi:hypothetical protein